MAACAAPRSERGGYNRETGAYASSSAAVPVAISASGVTGWISFYGDRFHGRKTASGEKFDMRDMTAAHRTLPFGTRVKVTLVGNRNSVVVRINDRGPWKSERVLDVSLAAAKKLGLVTQGTAKAKIEVLPHP